MIRGRHRALPVAIDRSILLPSDLDVLRRNEDIEVPDEISQEEKAGQSSTSVDRENSAWSTSTMFQPFNVPAESSTNASGNLHGTMSTTHGILRNSTVNDTITSPHSIRFAEDTLS
jgi:hypothetical protein